MERAEEPKLGAEYQNNNDEAYLSTFNLEQEWEAFLSEFSPLNSSSSNSAGLAETGNDFEREQVVNEMEVPLPDFWNELEFLSEGAMDGQLEAFPNAECPIYFGGGAVNLIGDLATTPTILSGDSGDLTPGGFNLLQSPIPLEVEAQVGEHSLSISTTDAPANCPQNHGTVKNGGRVRPSRGGAGENQFPCTICPKAFSQSGSLNRHVLSQHADHKSHKCPTCAESFFRARQLQSHMRTHAVKCPTCDKGFSNPTSLKVHINTHTGLRPFRCPDCPRGFYRAGSLKRHVLSKHADHKSHKCPTCKKSFSHPRYLKLHMMTHTGNHPYKCPTCEKGFLKPSSLKHHINTHTGYRPFRCPHCPRDFTQPGHLNTHVRSLHVRQEP